MAITVVIVDDHPIFREGLQLVLHGQSDIQVVGEAANGLDAVAVVARLEPDVVLMDLHLPALSGIEATARIVAAHPACAVLVLTMLDDEQNVRAAIAAGACGYLLKDSALPDIVRAVQAVAAGHVVLGAAVAGYALAASNPSAPARTAWSGLTERERQLVDLLARGGTTGQMAIRLGISTKTVRNHLSNIYTKLGVQDRGQAVLAIQRAAAGTDLRMPPSA